MSLLASLFGASQPVSADDHWITRVAGVQTHAGSTVNEHNALELPVVYSAIGIIADGLAQLPLTLTEKSSEVDEDGKVSETRTPLHDHPLHKVLNVRANPYMSAFTFQNTLMTHVLGWGNGYAEIQRDGSGEVIAIWPLLPDRTWPVQDAGNVKFVTQIGGEQVTLSHDRVLHVPAMGFDGLLGYSQLHMARQAIGLGKSLEEHGGKFFANEARSGGFLEHPGKLSEGARNNLRDSAQEQGGLSNAQRMKVLEEGMTFKPSTIPPEEAQFLQTRQFQLEEIARMYRVPLFMLQSQAKDTSWGTGITQMSLGFVRYTLSPWLIRIEQEFTFKLLGEAEEGVYIKHDVAGLLRGDAAARGAYYTQALSPTTGWMKVNEVRALEDLDPLDEEDEPEDGPEPMALPPQLPPAEELEEEEDEDDGDDKE